LDNIFAFSVFCTRCLHSSIPVACPNHLLLLLYLSLTLLRTSCRR